MYNFIKKKILKTFVFKVIFILSVVVIGGTLLNYKMDKELASALIGTVAGSVVGAFAIMCLQKWDKKELEKTNEIGFLDTYAISVSNLINELLSFKRDELFPKESDERELGRKTLHTKFNFEFNIQNLFNVVKKDRDTNASLVYSAQKIKLELNLFNSVLEKLNPQIEKLKTSKDTESKHEEFIKLEQIIESLSNLLISILVYSDFAIVEIKSYLKKQYGKEYSKNIILLDEAFVNIKQFIPNETDYKRLLSGDNYCRFIEKKKELKNK